jgi:Tfp pilus assembly protein PilP
MARSTATIRAALVAMLAVVGGAFAQSPVSASSGQAASTSSEQSKPAPAQPPASPSPQTKPDQQKPAEVYTYNPEGRRDPFVSLLFRGSDMRPTRENRAEGLPGLMINEITIRGIVRSRDGFVAMLAGPDNKTYIVHSSDKLLDGSVKAITADSVIFSQDVNDPLSLVKQREVRKYLRATQEGK